MGIPFFASEVLGSIILIALRWFGSYFFYSAQGWVAKEIVQIDNVVHK